MADIRDMTAEEAEARRYRSHEERAADSFKCPNCGADSGISSHTPGTVVVRCHACRCEFFAWIVPGVIHVSAKL